MSNAPFENSVALEWTEDRLPAAFAAMHRENEIALRATADAVMDAAGVAEGMTVLDVGCGSGIPALRMAVRVGPTGQVVATDPSPILIAATEKNANDRGLSNIRAVCCSVSNLPVEEASMDAAVAHFSAMFFPDVASGLAQIRRVLKPGARIGVAGWGPDDQNQFFGSYFGAASAYMPKPPAGAPPPPPDQPRPTRFAQSGRLTKELETAGFHDVWEETKVIELRWDAPPEHLLETMTRISGFALGLSPEQRSAYDRDVLAALQPFRTGDGLLFRSAVVVGSGAA